MSDQSRERAKPKAAGLLVAGSLLACVLQGAVCVGRTFAAGDEAQSPQAKGADAALGAIGEFALEDLDGQAFTQQQLRGKRAVVLLFLGTECPVSNGYAPLMAELAGRSAKLGVLVAGVHSDPTVTRESAQEHAKEYSLSFPIVLDPRQALARQAGATITPEAVLLTSEGKIAYRGRIDNRYSLAGKRRLDATSHELDDALAAVLAGRSPDTATAPAFGCPLPKLRQTSSQ